MLKRNLRYVLRRLLQAAPIVLGIVTCNFFLLHLAPGDPASVLAGEAGAATPEYIAQLRKQFGLDDPLYLQYFRYITNLLQFDLGYSFRHGISNAELILNRLGPTLLLMSAALLLSVCIGVGVGIYAALRRGRPQETVIVVLTVISYATPVFWVGLMLIVLFSINLGWLPTSGMETIGADKEGFARAVDIGRHLILPAVTLSLFYMALYTRLMRAAMLETLGTDFVITAHAKGLKRRRIIWLHVVRNAILPIVTMIGIQIGGLLGGSVIVESVFGWPGLGLLAFEALFARDLNLLLSVFFLSSVLVVFANIAVDLLYGVLDPRIRLA